MFMIKIATAALLGLGVVSALVQAPSMDPSVGVREGLTQGDYDTSPPSNVRASLAAGHIGAVRQAAETMRTVGGADAPYRIRDAFYTQGGGDRVNGIRNIETTSTN
jgi:hypothetical protein